MAEVRFAIAAEDDLVAIDNYSVMQFGEQVATTYMRGFEEAFAVLASFPASGAARPELGDNIRSFVHRQHLLIYRLDKDEVFILRVIHHAMSAKRALKRVGDDTSSL